MLVQGVHPFVVIIGLNFMLMLRYMVIGHIDDSTQESDKYGTEKDTKQILPATSLFFAES
jgi:hypothetical protein